MKYMSNMKILILAISFFVVCITFYNLFFYKKTSKENQINNSGFLKQDNQSKQSVGVYDKKNQILGVLKNKIKNKLELSWQFLYDITDIVLKRFSSSDREEINKIGKVLFKAGMRYNHVVEYGINFTKIRIEKNKKLEI